jgi:hypothetical protein
MCFAFRHQKQNYLNAIEVSYIRLLYRLSNYDKRLRVMLSMTGFLYYMIHKYQYSDITEEYPITKSYELISLLHFFYPSIL